MQAGTLLAQRYRIEEKLGEGGMGVVYKAHDTLLERLVAIKALSSHLLGGEGLKRLLREAQSAAKLTHPNIVAIHDVIEEGETRLIVMEYVAGRTLRELIPLPWVQAVEIAGQVCQALEYAHSQGVVHRDIKPENIVLTPDATAKVMDFGLARSEGRSRLTQTGMIVGTVAYMAPEQALQGAADARSDLYAMGCVLYEIITGRAPFEAEDPIAVITQHVNVPPVAPRFHSPGIPPVLEAVILKLLAKDPAARYKSAGDVAAALEGARGVGPGAAQPQAAVTGTALVQSVRRGILVGRDDELRILRTLLDEAASGEGRLVLTSGQAGVGKTRLIEELITYAHLRGVRVLSAKCYVGGTPYEPFGRMLREFLRVSEAGEVREALGDYAADLVRLAPEVRQKLGGLPESIPLPPEQERARLFESISRLFLALSRRAPQLLFVDDLHLADAATVQLLRYLAPAVAGERLLLAGAYQTEEADRTPAVAEVLRQLRRERHAATLEVKPLTLEQVTELIQRMANHPTPPVRFAGRIFGVTEGNPYFIEEVINALFEQGTLYIRDGQWSTDFDEGARYTEMPIPATLRAAIGTRLERLNEDVRQVLIPAAVLGRQFGVEALALMTGKDADALFDLLDHALAARLVREVRVEGEDRYEFTQSMTREAIYDGLARHRRRRLHLRAGEALEQLYGGRKDRAGEIADHLLEAGEEQRAVPYCVTAGEQAEALFAHDEAIRRLETAGELLEDAGKHEEAVRLLEQLGEPYLRAGQPGKAIECYERVLAHYEAQGERLKAAQVRRKIGYVYHQSWDFARAIPVLEQALQELGEEPGRDVLMLSLDLARAYTFGGQPERGLTWAQRALDLAMATGTADEIAAAHTEMGLGYTFLFEFGKAEAHYREAMKLAKQSTTYLGKSSLRRSINNLGAIEQMRGNFLSDLDARQQSLEIAQEIRDSSDLAFALINVGRALWRVGQWQSARTYYDRVVALGERAGIVGPLAVIHSQLLDEEWEEVLSALGVEMAGDEARGDLQSVGYELDLSAEVALLLGRPLEAERYARRAAKMGSHGFGDRDPMCLLAESLARQGRIDEAATACDEAEGNARKTDAKGHWGPVYHVRGLIAAVGGLPEEAIRHFGEAIRVLDEFPHPYAQARIFEDLGAVYTNADRAKALKAYSGALAIYDHLGARRSRQRVAEVIDRLKDAAT